MSKMHELKIDPAVFEAVWNGSKTHEIRFNDREFQVGDTLWLRETTHTGAEIKAGAPLEYTGREMTKTVSHVLSGYGLQDGWVILSLVAQPVSVQAEPVATVQTERAALVAQVGECCNGGDPLCAGGCLVEKAIRKNCMQGVEPVSEQAAQEPVAWITRAISDGVVSRHWLSHTPPAPETVEKLRADGYEVTISPLFAAPPVADSQDAALWAAVEGFEGMYEVSNTGRVRSLTRKDSDGNTRKGAELNPSPDAKGYLRVSLWKNHKVIGKTVHRLVAAAFCEKPEGCDEVNHIDGNKANNVAENLEWVTGSYNTLHAARVLKVLQIRAIKGTFLSDGTTIRFESFMQAEEAGFTRSLIHKCIAGDRTHHKGYKWEYDDAAMGMGVQQEGSKA